MQKAVKRKAPESSVTSTEVPLKKKSNGGPFKKDQGVKKFGPKKNFGARGGPAMKGKPFGNRTPAPPAKTDWNQLKQDKKVLRVQRKERRTKSKDLFELTIQAKKIYEKMKCKTEPNRQGLAKELHSLLKGSNTYSKLVLARDTARVVQCLFKVAPNEIKADVLRELLPSVPQMVASKYSHFCVAAVLKHGTSDMRDQVIAALLGHIVKLTAHSLASSTLDSIYVTWASNKQRASMRQEFYSDLYKRDKDPSVKCIADVYKATPHMKNIVLSNLKQHITHMANKRLADNSLFHAVILDFLGECSAEDRTEICALFVTQLASLASTKEGAKAAAQIFFQCAAKDRRAALKALKDHVAKVCVHEFGYYLIIAILHTMDDTKMLKKYVLDVIVTELDNMIDHEWGRKVIEWLALPGDASMFHPQFTVELDKGLLLNSKKDVAIRRSELWEATEGDLMKAIIARPEHWINSGHNGLTTATVLKRSGQKELLEGAFGALAQVVTNKDWNLEDKPSPAATTASLGDEEVAEGDGGPAKKVKKYKKNPLEDTEKGETAKKEAVKGIEDAGLHIALKKLAKEDSERVAKELPTFGEALVDALNNETLDEWTTVNRACFLLVTVFESASEATKKKLRELCGMFRATLAKQKFTGAKVLLQKLN